MLRNAIRCDGVIWISTDLCCEDASSNSLSAMRWWGGGYVHPPEKSVVNHLIVC